MNTRTILLNGAPVEVTRITDDPYRACGYESRADYLASLAADLEVDLDTVLMAAILLGPSEDFDGLVTMLEDYHDDDAWHAVCAEHAARLG